METYIARICWNESGWKRPSGSARETKSFYSEHKFGFEEWLSSADFDVGPWRYGFVQGINWYQKDRTDLDGKNIRLLFWAIRPRYKPRLFVGELEQCFVLSPEEANEAHDLLEKQGTIKRMIRDIDRVKGKSDIVRDKTYTERWSPDVINIKFRPRWLHQYSGCRVPVNSTVIKSPKHGRYHLSNADPAEVRRWDSVVPPEQGTGETGSEGRIKGALEGIEREDTWIRKTASRALRDKVFDVAGGRCEACTKNFSTVLSGKGVRVLHVHHRMQRALQDRPAITRPEDLAVVCANCHMLLHFDPKNAMPVEDLRRLLEEDEDRG